MPARLTLGFSAGNQPSLQWMQFKLSDKHSQVFSRRGIANGQFALNEGGKAFCLVILHYLIWSRSSRPGDFETKATRDSPSHSLHFILGKCDTGKPSQWMKCMFGLGTTKTKSGYGRFAIYDLFQRVNAEQKRKGSIYGLKVQPILQPDDISIVQGDEANSPPISELEKLQTLLNQLQSQWDGPPDGLVVSPPVQNATDTEIPEADQAEDASTSAGAVDPSPTHAPALLFPFRPIEDADQLFRTEGVSPKQLPLPSRLDFENGGLYQRRLFSDIVRQLDDQALAVIVGGEGSGKTTLALQVAFARLKAKLPVFYLDMGEISGGNQNQQVVSATSIAARHRCLLILDNAHRINALTSAVLHEWRRARSDSQLLIVSRPALEAGEQSEWMPQPPFVLTVTEDDLRDTLETIALRFAKSKNWVRSIPPHDFREWSKYFGDNLAVFAFAATGRFNAFPHLDFSLGPGDAQIWVRKRYLDPADAPLSMNERTALLRLAAMGQFELRAPNRFLRDRLRHSINSGIVQETTIPGFEDSEFSLTHPALGKLLLAAADKDEVDQLAVLRAFMEQYPERAIKVVHAVLIGCEGDAPGDSGRKHRYYGVAALDATQFFREWLSSPRFHALDVVDSSNLFRRLLYGGFTTHEPAIDDAFLARADRVTALVLDVGFYQLLIDFLSWAEMILPNTHTMLLKEFKKPKNRDKLITLMLDCHGFNADFIPNPPRTRTDKFKSWLLEEALSCSNHQAVLGFIWRSSLRVSCEWLKRVSKATGATKFKQLLNLPDNVKLATRAVFKHQVVGGLAVDSNVIQSLSEALGLIQNEMPKEVKQLFKTIFSQEPGSKQLAEILSTVPKDEPGLDELWKLLAEWIPAEQLQVIQGSLGTVDLDEFSKKHCKSLEQQKPATTPDGVTLRYGSSRLPSIFLSHVRKPVD